MTAAAPGQSSPGDADWVAAYEDLRRAATAADGRDRRLPGITVVLRAGVAGWMQTCQSLVGYVPAARRDSAPARMRPDTVRAEVAMLLAQMALSAAGERTT
jgi:hypothetical protein